MYLPTADGQAILNATPPDHADCSPLHQAHETYVTVLQQCNERLREVEAQLQLQKIENQLDVSRLKEVGALTGFSDLAAHAVDCAASQFD